jgi:hypothetical protein
VASLHSARRVPVAILRRPGLLNLADERRRRRDSHLPDHSSHVFLLNREATLRAPVKKPGGHLNDA